MEQMGNISHTAYIIKSGPHGRKVITAGVGFAHRDGEGVSLKFDVYPGDDEKDVEIVVRERSANKNFITMPGTSEYAWDLCQVKEHDSSYNSGSWNRWAKIGKAIPHTDGRGYTMVFDIRPSRLSVETGGNLVLRATKGPPSLKDGCPNCGH